MPLLNPFLRAFFRSHLVSQCSPVQDHILLVPLTEVLTNTRDRESGTLYSDLAGQDEFLGSHVLRIPGGSVANAASIVGSRESRGKARQYTTINGRTVVIKDSWVYSNKGFRSLNQAQLLNDVCYYPDVVEPQQWLIYYISRPLVGSLEQVPIVPAQIQLYSPKGEDSTQKPSSSTPGSSTSSSASPRKKRVDSFHELLTLFPLISRQMQSGLDDIYVKFGRSFEKPLPPSPPSSAVPSVSSTSSAGGSNEVTGVSFASDSHNIGDYRSIRAVVDEHSIRRALEIAVASAIDLFQRVDQSQLSLIASTTDLTGPVVERLIERYMTEQLHDTLLFPRVCLTKREEDEELDRKIKAMENVDLTQVGIPSLDQKSKLGLIKRLTKGIETFRKIGSAKSPHAMMELLLETAQSLTKIDEIPIDQKGQTDSEKEKSFEDGTTTIVTMNADMLVSLLLIVVIRSKVPHLTACLSYMRNYVFLDDVEQGEIGYILSTLEAVIYHIIQDNDQLSLASARNRDLWRCIRKGNVDGVRRILEPSEDEQVEESGNESNGDSESYSNNLRIDSASRSILSDESDDDINNAQSPFTGEIDDNFGGIEADNLDGRTAGSIGDALENSRHEEGVAEVSEDKYKTDTTTNANIDIPSQIPASDGDPLAIEDHATPEEIVKDIEQLSMTQDTESTPLISRDTEDNTRSVMDDSFQATEVVANGVGKGKENEAFSAIVFPRRSPIPSSTSLVSLATTIRDALSLNQLSRTQTTTSHNTSASQVADITSIEKLSKTRNSNGDSVLMMAIQERQPKVLRYLLDCPYFPMAFMLDDDNNDGTTLLCAAIQSQNIDVANVLMEALMKVPEDALTQYFQRTDHAGRTVGHYLFHTPDLIEKLGPWIPWKQKDKNGQTPLFALCRSYDHPRYREMVKLAIQAAQEAQKDSAPLHLDEHVDNKGNTLLHIAGDPVVLKILLKCDAEVNAVNDKGFTPLMVASKYGRVDSVRSFFGDPRVDLLAKELRGLTAVELAKDDDVRNRIDDLVLFTNPPNSDGRVTAVVRSFFVEDATIRFVIKSGAPSGQQTLTITTCRRSLQDFEFLGEWLAYENPASWLPALPPARSPFQIPSKPSRAILRDIQLRLDFFLRTLLSHSTFSTHELLWEFFLVPELHTEQLIERSKRKAETRNEKIREDYSPVEDIKEVEVFVSHAKDAVRSITYAFRSITRRATVIRSAILDFTDAYKLNVKALSSLKFLEPTGHINTLNRFVDALTPNDSHPHMRFVEDLRDIQASLTGVMTALDRPKQIISEMAALQKQIDRHVISLRRSDKWPLGLLDETRSRIHEEAAEKVRKAREEYLGKASELRWTQGVAAAELAAFHELRERMVKRAVRSLAQRSLLAEKTRLEAMRRAIRGVMEEKVTPKTTIGKRSNAASAIDGGELTEEPLEE
ncbi:hypothetical protein BDZ91DRAFT_689392 [Kalaharituber pfeilii]|nr:hypothetical protein BDZ91DRAFT_689392 [Kalaharituber pfeilii]